MAAERQHLNLAALDSLALQYAQEEALLRGSSSGHSSASQLEDLTAKTRRDVVEEIRFLTEAGKLQEAIELTRRWAPDVLGDQQLLFRLLKQEFIELLRTKDEGAVERALQFTQEQLVPCALDAYPEAYSHFKNVMLALLYDQNDESSPIAAEWSITVREELAGTLASAVRASLHAHDPQLSLLLRYLVSIHDRYYQRQQEGSSVQSAASSVLLGKRDPPVPPNSSIPPHFQESGVQNLAHAIDLPRQAAVDSLRNTSGDVTQALKNELSRIRVSRASIDDLVKSYLEYRGLVNCSKLEKDSSHTPEGDKESAWWPTKGTGNNTAGCSVSTVLHSGHGPEGELKERVGVRGGEQSTGTGEPSTSAGPGGSDNTWEEGQLGTSGEGAMAAIAAKKRAARKRALADLPHWRGRPEGFREGGLTPVPPAESAAAPPAESAVVPMEVSPSNGHSSSDPVEDVRERYKRALEIREMMSEGLAEEVVAEVQSLDPHFFADNPELLFHLRQCEFLRMVEAGEYPKALALARSDLGPLAAQHPQLLQLLKGTLLAFAKPSSQLPTQPPPAAVLAGALQVALGASLGMSEPVLIRLMRGLLHAHTEWFKLQVCEDPFKSVLGIDALKQAEDAAGAFWDGRAGGDSKEGMPSKAAACNPASTGVDDSFAADGSIFSETSILTLMEFMAVSRVDAIQLLAQYDGSVESVFSHLLA